MNKLKNGKFYYNCVNDTFAQSFLDNTFEAFKSIDDILYLIYSNKNKSIILYNIIDNKIINEIKNSHKSIITNFRYFFDKNNKRDLILSISSLDNNIKLWNINNYECLLNLYKINKIGYLNSACFLKENNQLFIVTSNFYYCSSESIKIFDLNGNLIKEINDSNEKTYFIDSFYDKELFKNYILTGNVGYVKSYDYNENKIYHKYSDDNKRYHYSIIMHYNDNIKKLIESCSDGSIRIWNFHSGELLDKIIINDKGLNSIILYNDNYLLVGCNEKKIKLINFKSKIIKDFLFLNRDVICLKLIKDSKGDILLFQGLEITPINIYIINS